MPFCRTMPAGKITAEELPDSGSAFLKKKLFEQKIVESKEIKTSAKHGINTSGQTKLHKENFENKANTDPVSLSSPSIEIEEVEISGRAKSHASLFEQIAAEQQAVSPSTRRKFEGGSVTTKSLGKLFEEAAKKEDNSISSQRHLDDEVDFSGNLTCKL